MTRGLHPDAEKEFAEAACWYEDRSMGLGSRFSDAIALAFDVITRDPGRFQPAGGDVRVFRLDRWPYKIYYEFDEAGQHVRILCVMHNKRRPDYWRARQTA